MEYTKQRQLGSIEGFIVGTEKDGDNFVVTLKERLDGKIYQCVFYGGYDKAGEMTEGRRVRIRGEYIWNIMKAQEVHFYKLDSELPSKDDIIDPDFTGGVDSVTYVRRLRDGD